MGCVGPHSPQDAAGSSVSAGGRGPCVAVGFPGYSGVAAAGQDWVDALDTLLPSAPAVLEKDEGLARGSPPCKHRWNPQQVRFALLCVCR